MNFFDDKTILITGAAGSIGSALVDELLKLKVKAVRALDVNESGLVDLYRFHNDTRLKILIGDIKDYDRVKRAAKNADIIMHLASLKHVNTCEFDPEEALKINVIGTLNVMKAAIYNKVSKVVYTSSDKAANPDNTYGATKALSEKIFNAAAWGSGGEKTIFCSVRFGNVMGTRGGIIPLWKKQISLKRPVTITDPNMTRYMMTKTEAIRLILKATKESKDKWGGIFVLKMKIIRIGDLADILAGEDYPKKLIGLTPGETYGELLMSKNELNFAKDCGDYYFIPSMLRITDSKVEPNGDVLSSDVDSLLGEIVSKEELKKMLLEDGLL